MERNNKGQFVKGHKVSKKCIETLIKNNHKSKRFTGRKHTENAKKKIGKASKGNKYALGNKPNKTSYKKGQRAWNIGKKATEETKKKISESRKGQKAWNKGLEMPKGKLSAHWKGGITPLTHTIRLNKKYKKWVESCLKRDKVCQKCETKENLIVHHKKHFSKIFEENNIKNLETALNCRDFWRINNGVTLCRSCHNKIHKNLLKWKAEENAGSTGEITQIKIEDY